jgi:hypothetical protein
MRNIPGDTKGVKRKIAGLLERLRTDGIVQTMRYARHLVSENFYERYFGINTAEQVLLESIGVTNPLCKCYSPIAFRSFKQVMKHVSIDSERDVFVDYGCGKGRVIVLAATCPFRRVIGVEIAPELSRMAIDNVRRARRFLKCRDVQILTMNAVDFVPPDDTTVMHFFNPFYGELMDMVLQTIRKSVERSPRAVSILAARPLNFQRSADKCAWLVPRGDVYFPFRDPREPEMRSKYRIYDVETRQFGPKAL